MLELINRARENPLAEAQRYDIDLNEDLDPGTISASAKQPLFMNLTLVEAARAHSDWMLDTDTFSHTGVDGSSPGDRIAAAGYDLVAPWGWGENVSWRGTTGSLDDHVKPNLASYIDEQHGSLFLSSGHRKNIMAEGFREIGVGQSLGKFTSGDSTIYSASMITQKFAFSGDDIFLGGVAYKDSDGDNFYSLGEGLEGIKFSLPDLGLEVETLNTGGYQLAVPSGTHQVVVSGEGLQNSYSKEVTLSDKNKKLDLVLDVDGTVSGGWEVYGDAVPDDGDDGVPSDDEPDDGAPDDGAPDDGEPDDDVPDDDVPDDDVPDDGKVPVGEAAPVYAGLFLKEMVGNDSLEGGLFDVFVRVLGRQLEENAEGHLEPSPAFDILASVFSFVLSDPDDRPPSPLVYSSDKIADAHAFAHAQVFSDVLSYDNVVEDGAVSDGAGFERDLEQGLERELGAGVESESDLWAELDSWAESNLVSESDHNVVQICCSGTGDMVYYDPDWG
ncbi:CAP domain-containing protein [Halorhodospira abdelmalekii]|uniref:CAP domain-containing protein n=1 Tax=Halorhodospira abdelmalekii TaxID=421629 RepID=UPI0019059CC4|nr:CAP domain-containing protein [Halorhodospira abdelmalekii]